MASHLIQRFRESLQLAAEVSSIILIEGKLRHIITQCTSERKGIWTGDSFLWVQENGAYSLLPPSKPSSNSSFKSIICTQGIVNLLRKGKGAWNFFIRIDLSCTIWGMEGGRGRHTAYQFEFPFYAFIWVLTEDQRSWSLKKASSSLKFSWTIEVNKLTLHQEIISSLWHYKSPSLFFFSGLLQLFLRTNCGMNI